MSSFTLFFKDLFGRAQTPPKNSFSSVSFGGAASPVELKTVSPSYLKYIKEVKFPKYSFFSLVPSYFLIFLFFLLLLSLSSLSLLPLPPSTSRRPAPHPPLPRPNSAPASAPSFAGRHVLRRLSARLRCALLPPPLAAPPCSSCSYRGARPKVLVAFKHCITILSWN